jgi:hypothetical protein
MVSKLFRSQLNHCRHHAESVTRQRDLWGWYKTSNWFLSQEVPTVCISPLPSPLMSSSYRFQRNIRSTAQESKRGTRDDYKIPFFPENPNKFCPTVFSFRLVTHGGRRLEATIPSEEGFKTNARSEGVLNEILFRPINIFSLGRLSRPNCDFKIAISYWFELVLSRYYFKYLCSTAVLWENGEKDFSLFFSPYLSSTQADSSMFKKFLKCL